MNLDPRGKPDRPSCWVVMQYIRAGNQTRGVTARTRSTLLSRVLSALAWALLISLHDLRCFTFNPFSFFLEKLLSSASMGAHGHGGFMFGG